MKKSAKLNKESNKTLAWRSTDGSILPSIFIWPASIPCAGNASLAYPLIYNVNCINVIWSSLAPYKPSRGSCCLGMLKQTACWPS